MIELPGRNSDPDTIRPSLLYNGILASGCLVLAIAMFGAEGGTFDAALLMAVFLVLSAAVMLSAHLPGATGVWLDDEGFLTRELFKGERFLWTEVGPFIVRRRLVGTGVEFPYVPDSAKMPQTKSLPRGMGRSAWKLAQLMNERRAEALGAEN